MLIHPNINPVAVELGPYQVFGLHLHLQVHWYGLMFLLGFWGGWWLALRRARWPFIDWPRERVGDLLFYVVLGVILGGRIGYMLFYAYTPEGRWLEWQDPLTVFRIWDGGMSFHGGLLGVIAAMLVFGRQQKLGFWEVADFVAVVIPVGLFTGRLGNFINGELWGAPTSLPWGMVFQNAPDDLPRHPSQLYEAALEGLAMLAILWWFGRKPRPRAAISGLFLLLYATFRFAVEFVREPDKQFGHLYHTTWFTMGMQLCLPMFAFGGAFLWMAYHGRTARLQQAGPAGGAPR